MLTSTKLAFAGLGALALYLALSPSTATILSKETNGSSDGSVQRSVALGDLTNDKTGTFAYAAIYDADEMLAVDPDTGRDFVVARI